MVGRSFSFVHLSRLKFQLLSGTICGSSAAGSGCLGNWPLTWQLLMLDWTTQLTE